MDALMDPNDQALMEGLSALGPLLLGNRRQQEVLADEQHTKRHKARAKNDSDGPLPGSRHLDAAADGATDPQPRKKSAAQPAPGTASLCSAKNRPEGIVPHLTCLASKWREEWPKQRDNLSWPNLRTYLLQGVIKELRRRVQQLASSKPGEQLWDVALSKGTILPDGAWGYQKWSVETKQLVKAPKKPMPMATMLRTLETLEDLLDSNQTCRSVSGVCGRIKPRFPGSSN